MPLRALKRVMQNSLPPMVEQKAERRSKAVRLVGVMWMGHMEILGVLKRVVSGAELWEVRKNLRASMTSEVRGVWAVRSGLTTSSSRAV